MRTPHRSTSHRPVAAVALVATVLLLATSCGSSGSDDTSAATSGNPTTTTAEAATSTGAPDPQPSATATTAQPTTTPPTSSPATSGPSTTVGAPMPDVVGLGLQDAQDLIQTTGVFYSRSFDCTGAGRRQVLDRNWVVVTQSPAPGTPIGEGDALLGVVKLDEPRRCT